MVLGMMLVFSIGITSVMIAVTSTQSDTARSSSRNSGASLAESGLNTALSKLYTATDPTSASALTSTSWSANGGTAAYTATLSGNVWTITGTGTLTSPVAGAGTVRRSVSQSVAVGMAADSAWHYLFADDAAGCLTINNNADISAPIYSRGDLCVGNNSHLTGSPVQIEGNLSLGNNASVGTLATPIASANIASCGSPAHACTTADSVYATSLTQITSQLTKPTLDLPGWYANAKPGPSHNCTTGSMPGGFDNDATFNRSRAAFSLTPGSSYDCQYWESGSLVGRLSWNAATNVLTVLGTILFDGPLTIGTGTYSGRGTIYATGQITSGNGDQLCGVAACDSTWDPDTNLLVLVSGEQTLQFGIDFANNTVFQGALYAVNDYNAKNNVQNFGPIIARQIFIKNNPGIMLTIPAMPPGAPGADTLIQPVKGSWRN
jgi:hypothetical protein